MLISLTVAALVIRTFWTLLTPDGFDWDAIKYVYVFGDSYSYVQGTLGRQNFR